MTPLPTPTGLAGDESRDALQRYIDMERSVLFHALSVADAKAGFALAISLGLALVQLHIYPR